MPKRAIIMIIDACGIGSMPDWANYDEVAPANTLASVCAWAHKNSGGIKLPQLQKMGIANIVSLDGLPAIAQPIASYGRMAELNDAKDTITGHWEMMGVKTTNAFPYYPNGFSEEIISKFKSATGVQGIYSNAPASGTEVINEFGDEHRKTGYPIIYTSADSVMQIATDIDVVPLETLYKWCEIAREIMRGDNEVARIIARPYRRNPDVADSVDARTTTKLHSSKQKYIRVGDKRHDYAVVPHSKTVMETVIEAGGEVVGLGKISDIFAEVGVSKNIHTDNNADGLEKFLEVLKTRSNINQLVFLNLVETDANFGHRRDPEGYAKALEAIDEKMPEVLHAMTEEDVLFITADHGCDPCAAGTDHTREYVPILMYSPGLRAQNLGTRKSFADMGATILQWFAIDEPRLSIQAASMI